VRSRISGRRYAHVLGVARAGARLAALHGASSSAARVAGVVHDIAREWTPDALLEYAKRHDLVTTPTERAMPVLLHAPVAADVARREFGIEEEEILSAIAAHTVARRGMSVLDKCVFVADAVEPSRTFADRPALWQLAQRDLERAFFSCVKSSILYLLGRGVPIASQTVEVYNDMVLRYGQAS